MDPYHAAALRAAADLAALKDRLRRCPEASFHERETTALITARLAADGLEILDIGMDTGVVALLRGARPGPVAALRADIDAVPGPGGPAHRCGHDLHAAALCGAARILAGDRAALAGTVAFVFQPAEEVTRGAQAMLDHGLVEALPGPVIALFGLHCWPGFPAGAVGLREGPLMAGKINFVITLRGKGGHGGLPHACVDVIVPGAAIVHGIQTVVSRSTDPFEPLVCGVCTIHAGDADFFVTDALRMTGSIRALREAALDHAAARLRDLAGSIAAGYGCGVDVETIREVPVLVNDPALGPLARAAAAALGPAAAVDMAPLLASDDMAVFGTRVPVYYYFLGVGFEGRVNPPLHDPGFEANPAALPLGAALLARSAVLALEAGRGL